MINDQIIDCRYVSMYHTSKIHAQNIDNNIHEKCHLEEMKINIFHRIFKKCIVSSLNRKSI